VVSEEDLKEEQKQAMEKAIEEYRQLCLKSFSLNKSGQVIQKQDLSLPRQVTFDSNPDKLQEMVNYAVNHALINHSNVLSNTVHNAVVQTLKEGQASLHYVGPAYHQPEPASVNTPSAPSAVVGTEVTSPLVSADLPNMQSTPIRSDAVLSRG
jgi:TRAP-type C4-dicarboxylate transport system substrate-binding protein